MSRLSNYLTHVYLPRSTLQTSLGLNRGIPRISVDSIYRISTFMGQHALFRSSPASEQISHHGVFPTVRTAQHSGSISIASLTKRQPVIRPKHTLEATNHDNSSSEPSITYHFEVSLLVELGATRGGVLRGIETSASDNEVELRPSL